MTINADGASSEVKFQANGVEKASISAAGAFTSTTIDATALTGNLPAIDGSSLTNLPGGGITESDTWRLTSTFAGASYLTTNLERSDHAGAGFIGSGMTQTSGVFTFPSTGIYSVVFSKWSWANAQHGRVNNSMIYLTTDGTNYTNVAYTADSLNSNAQSATWYSCLYLETVVDITNTSTHKVKFRVDADSTVATGGSTSEDRTYMRFTRLGDT